MIVFMTKKTLRQRLISYLKRNGGFVNGGELERLALDAGFKASTVSRRARECAEEGIIERKEEKGSVWYRYKSREVKKVVTLFTKQGTVRLIETTIYE